MNLKHDFQTNVGFWEDRRTLESGQLVLSSQPGVLSVDLCPGPIRTLDLRLQTEAVLKRWRTKQMFLLQSEEPGRGPGSWGWFSESDRRVFWSSSWGLLADFSSGWSAVSAVGSSSCDPLTELAVCGLFAVLCRNRLCWRVQIHSESRNTGGAFRVTPRRSLGSCPQTAEPRTS